MQRSTETLYLVVVKQFFLDNFHWKSMHYANSNITEFRRDKTKWNFNFDIRERKNCSTKLHMFNKSLSLKKKKSKHKNHHRFITVEYSTFIKQCEWVFQAIRNFLSSIVFISKHSAVPIAIKTARPLDLFAAFKFSTTETTPKTTEINLPQPGARWQARNTLLIVK